MNLEEKYKREYYVNNPTWVDSEVIDKLRVHPNALAIARYSDNIYGVIADLGSNHSATTLIAAENTKVTKAVGVNLNKEAIERFDRIKKFAGEGAEEKTSMVRSNVLELDQHFEEASFDTLMSFHMLEHLFPEDIHPAMEQMSRILKPGGFFIISIPWERKLGSPNHKTFWNNTSLSKLFISHGFKVYECYRVDDNHLTGAFIKQ